MLYAFKPKGQRGPIKIGTSDRPQSRLLSASAWSPVELEMVFTIEGSFAEERGIHAYLQSARLHGEWFAPTPDVISFMDHVLTHGALPDLNLGDREARIKKMRAEGMSLQQIGSEFQISRERVRQILSPAKHDKNARRQEVIDDRHRRCVRIEARASPFKFDDVLSAAEVSVSQWARWEGGGSPLTERTLARLERALDAMESEASATT